jgi:hypothetical protein
MVGGDVGLGAGLDDISRAVLFELLRRRRLGLDFGPGTTFDLPIAHRSGPLTIIVDNPEQRRCPVPYATELAVKVSRPLPRRSHMLAVVLFDGMDLGGVLDCTLAS